MKNKKIEIIEEEIYRKFNKITPTGMLSKTRSRNLCSFLGSVIRDGLEKTKENHSKSIFYNNMKDLGECGVTTDFINEEHEKRKFKEKKIEYEFIEIKFDFNDQVPKDYVEPKSQFSLEELLEKVKSPE